MQGDEKESVRASSEGRKRKRKAAAMAWEGLENVSDKRQIV